MKRKKCLRKIDAHMRGFLAKMADLRKQGYRSGGWDKETDTTAIVKVEKAPHDNRIVGYIDRNLNIMWCE